MIKQTLSLRNFGKKFNFRSGVFQRSEKLNFGGSKNFKMFFVFLILLGGFFVCGVGKASAATFNDVTDGNWNSGATWGNPGNNIVGSGYPGGYDAVTIDSNIVTINDDQDASSLAISGGTLNGGSSTLSIQNGMSLMSGVFSPELGTVRFIRIATISGNINFNNLVFNTDATTARTTTMTGAILTVDGSLVIDNSSTGALGLSGGTIYCNGDVNVDIADINQYYHSTNLIFSGSGNQSLILSRGSTTIGYFLPTIINKLGGTLSVDGILRTNQSFTSNSGTVDWTTHATTLSLAGGTFVPGSSIYHNIYISAVTLGGDLTLDGNFANAGSFTSGSDTVIFVGGENSTLTTGGTAITQDFQNLTINKSGSGTVQLSTNGLDVDGNLTISSGTLDLNGQDISTATNCSSSGILKLTGDEILSCTPTLNFGSTVEYSATTGTRAIKDWAYQNLDINGSGGTFIDSGARTILGNLILNAGTYIAPTTLNVAGDWINGGGNFNANSGTVNLIGNDQSIFGSNTFYNLSKKVVTVDIITFDNSATQTVFGTLTFSGILGNLLSLQSDFDGFQWEIDSQGNRAINHVSYKDSNSINSRNIDSVSSIDAGNNAGWNAPIEAPIVSMTVPSDGVTVSNGITVSVSAISDLGIAGVQFKLDGNNFELEDTSYPYSILWDTTTASEGSHFLTAIARDNGGNFSTAINTIVTVDNSASTITQYGVTWTFDKEYRFGKFVSGDYWVVDPGSGIQLDISPLPENGLNGSQVNPQNSSQPFDNRTENYDASLLFNSGETLHSGDSLISTISENTPGDDTDVLGRNVADEHDVIQSAAVLTVLSSVPNDNSFRPSIFGTDKTIYNYNDVDISIFANLPASTKALSHMADTNKSVTENYARYFSRPWIIWGADWQGRYIHPLDNMPNYYEYCYDIYSEGGEIINSDLPGKEDVLKGIIQLGIDTYYATNAGNGDRTVSKFPMLVAGMALHQPNLYATNYQGFKEIFETYYGTGWSSPAPDVLWRSKVGLEYEDAYPSEWGDRAVSAGTGYKMEDYRRCCSSNSWSGIALSIHVMHAEEEWNHNAFLDYMDRWHYEVGVIDTANIAVIRQYSTSFGYEPGGMTESSFTSDMWNTYRSNYKAIRADVDSSSSVTSVDALLTLRNSIGLSMNGTAWQTSSTTGDVNCDGVSNSTDALLILRFSVGLSMGSTAWCEGN